jgi:hypothetical protein
MATESEKLDALRALYLDGVQIEVAELVKVAWPSPTGDIYYVSTLDDYILRNLSEELPGASLEQRLPAREFQDILNDTTIADDRVKLKLWDGDAVVSDLANEHGSGQRVEIFYWFPQVSLLLSQFFGHLQPVEESSIDWFEVNAEVGFLSSMLPLPRRGIYNTCSALFGGWLTTQREIDEGDCPYSRHLSDTPGAGTFATDTSWKCTDARPPADWQQLGFDDSGWGDAVDQAALDSYPWNYAGAPPPFPAGSDAHWIWDHDSLSTPDSKTVWFRKTFTAVEGDALLTVSGDNAFTAYLNGETILTGDDWRRSKSAVLVLTPGQDYVIAIQVRNGEASNNFAASPGGLVAQLSYGIQGVGIGNLDPATGQPFTDCARTRPQCIARLGDDLNYLGFDTVIQSYVVGQTKGPAITVTTRGNESNLKRPLRVIFGKRHVQDLDLLAYTVEPDTRHPEGGFVSTLFAISEGPIKSQANQKVNGQVIAAQHLNARNGTPRQPRTGFSKQVSNYSSTALFFGRAGPGDFTKTTADELRGEVDVEGLVDVRRYISETAFVEEYSTDRAWALLKCLTNKRWGHGLDVSRVVIQDFINLSPWGRQIVSFTDADGTHYTGPRTSFNAELIDRSTQQQIADICRAGRFSLPFRDHGKIRVVPLAAAPELLLPSQFTDKAFLGCLQRVPDAGEATAWADALAAAIETSSAALLAEATSRVHSLFIDDDYTALATSDEQFVTDCYAAYLGRVDDSDEGHAFWVHNTAENGRAATLAGFESSGEFSERVGGMMGEGIALFTDRGDARNIIWENGRTTLVTQKQTDADLPNRVIVLLDDEEHNNAERPIGPFEDEKAQLAAGRAFGDTTRRAVEKTYPLLGVTNLGEAVRNGNLLLHLGEFDEGGTKNNLRVQFKAWIGDCLSLHKYTLIKVESDRLDRLNEKRAAKELEPFNYFRIRTLRRLPNLMYEINAQAYPREYYDAMESWTTPPPLIGTGGDPNPGGDRHRPPVDGGIDEDGTSFDIDRIHIKLARPLLP